MGAVASVALMVGLMAWGWQLVSRDVSGVPVIRAVQGEARTTAEDPGGQLTNHTGLAVNSVAGGQVLSPTEQVAIAPAPVDLSADDVAMGELGATAREPSNPSETPLTLAGEPIVPLLMLSVRLVNRRQFSATASTMDTTKAPMIAQMPATEDRVVSP